MSSKPPNNPEGLRDVAISRRGGVRTRGGRLPPISMRDIAQVTGTKVTGTKKAVAPNIPQRRAVKKEVDQNSTLSTFLKKEPTEDSRQKRNRPAKVFLQTQGTFLAEGPAARIKKESPADDVSYSLPRVSKSELKTSESLMKYDLDNIKDVLDSYEANQFYEDDLISMPPYRLPLLKKKETSEIQIKKEPEDDDNSPEVKIKKEIDFDSPKIKDEQVIDEKGPLKYFQDVENSGMLILLKLPNPWLFDKREGEADSKSEIQEIDHGGCIGTLRFMRSGRMKMVLGSHELELMDRIQSESYMEAAFIESRGKEGDIVVVDKIDRIMALSPILGNLLESDEPSTSFCEDQ